LHGSGWYVCGYGWRHGHFWRVWPGGHPGHHHHPRPGRPVGGHPGGKPPIGAPPRP
jgi:hypothetical protein